MCHKKVDDRGALCGWPRLSEYNEHSAFACACARASRAWVCALYHCKQFCWCFLLLILSLGSCYIKLLSGSKKRKKKVVSSASVHIYTAHSTRTLSVCVGRGWEQRKWRREAQIQKHKYLRRGEKETERRKRQAAWKREHCVMLSREREITLQTQEHKGSIANSVAQQSMLRVFVFGKKTYSSITRTTTGDN